MASKSTILCDNRGLQLLYHSITQFVFIFASLSDTSGSDLPFVMFNPRAWFSITHEQNIICSKTILVPRGRAPFGQHQESRPLARSNTGSPRFTDFPSLCACPESSMTNLIGSALNLLCLQSHSKPECRWTGPEVAILGADQKEGGLWGRECSKTR